MSTGFLIVYCIGAAMSYVVGYLHGRENAKSRGGSGQ